MVENFLGKYFNDMQAEKNLKKVVEDVIGTLYKKTVRMIKQKYIEIGIEKVRRLKSLNKVKKFKDFEEHRNKSVEPRSLQGNNEEVLIFLKKMKNDKVMRERRQMEREREVERRRIVAETFLAQQKAQERIRNEEEKQRRLWEVREKSLKRREEVKGMIEFGNYEYKKVVNSKPMHEKIEENYMRKVILPELERHKLELAKKRELFQPITRSSILYHARKHDLLISEHEIQKLNISHDHSYNPSKFHSKFTLAYIQSERNKRLHREDSFIEKKHLQSKKKHYANLVLQMYTPKVDPAKQLELKMIKERLDSQNLVKKWSVKSLNTKDSIVDSEKIKKRKWKPNKMIPESPPKREIQITDYLAQQRSKKEGFRSVDRRKVELNKSQSEETIKKQLSLIENAVRKKELRMEVLNKNNLKGVQEIGKIGELLVDSIKAKMALLEKERNSE